MEDLAARLRSIPDLRVHDSPPGSVSPPAAVVGFPDAVTFDAGYHRGLDRLEIPIIVVVGKPSEAAARHNLNVYCASTGAKSIKQVLESASYDAFDTLRLAGFEFAVITIGTTDYLAAVGTAEITGTGG